MTRTRSRCSRPFGNALRLLQGKADRPERRQIPAASLRWTLPNKGRCCRARATSDARHILAVRRRCLHPAAVARAPCDERGDVPNQAPSRDSGTASRRRSHERSAASIASRPRCATGHQSLAGRGGGRDPDVHGGARHDDRQRRPALHRRRTFGGGDRQRVGHHQLPGRQRHHPADQRLVVGRTRPAQLFSHFDRGLHVRLGACAAWPRA